MPDYEMHIGDCIDVLKTLPAGSVNCCVTSPPYLGLRDYGCTGQIGLEATPEEYVAKLVAVFREVRRVLREDGTLWLNLGDSYSSGNSGQTIRDSSGGVGGGKVRNTHDQPSAMANPGRKPVKGMKPKDLIGIPWRVAFALQADGWYLRQDIIWHKPNPMPESVTDRCTKAHEYIFLLSKSARYYYDAEAVKEKQGEVTRRAATFRNGGDYTGGNSFNNSQRKEKDSHGDGEEGTGRNRRSVWTVATKPFKGAHFATFPPKLIEPCILAGCPSKVCAACGAPWERVVEGPKYEPQIGKRFVDESRADKTRKLSGPEYNKIAAQRRTIGHRPTCECEGATHPGTVLDPFNGAGTTGVVALQHKRRYVGIELSPKYAEMAGERIEAATAQTTLF